MKGILAATVSVLAMLIAPSSLSAKGDIVKVVIKGASLTTPIEITDPIIKTFGVWTGPGVRVNGVEENEGFIIDWPKGVVGKRPDGLRHYEVSFYAKGQEERLVYVVWYDFDPSVEQGYIYLPGRGDEWYALNTFTIFHGHGLEGNWFRATSAWEKLARPIIRKATIRVPSQ